MAHCIVNTDSAIVNADVSMQDARKGKLLNITLVKKGSIIDVFVTVVFCFIALCFQSTFLVNYKVKVLKKQRHRGFSNLSMQCKCFLIFLNRTTMTKQRLLLMLLPINYSHGLKKIYYLTLQTAKILIHL